MLLAPAWQRILVALAAVAALWGAVLWVARSAPRIDPAQPAARVAAQPDVTAAAPAVGGLRQVVWSGLPAPGGGRFDRFNAAPQPVAAPVNARGQVAFYATVLHAPAREGLFLAEGTRITRIAAYGDPVPGGGTLAGFAAHPIPALNAAGHVAFTAEIAGGRATEGVFVVADNGLRVIALAGDDAPGLPAGVLVDFDAPALNDNDELAFTSTVRRGRDLLDVLYFWNGQRLQRIAAEGDRLLRIGGTMDKIGAPTLNNSGVIAFPASVIKGPALGGIFLAGSRPLSLAIRAGDPLPDGTIVLRFSERLSIDDDGNVAFGAFVGHSGAPREAILRAGVDGLSVIAMEGAAAPGGGRYAGFGPWPEAAPDGTMAFIAAVDGGTAPLAAFAGEPGGVQRAAGADERLPDGGRIGPFALNAVASAGGAGTVTFATVAGADGGRNAIWCRCPGGR
ncbi:MAG TPA: choice-of-anchor tandem repeat NxxGxxAF-containing protein [Rhodopila sp.]|nr:choice-of-anchor tandem repeat NxxGxxAF-containing protein [Rhodopila sp.]